MAAIAERLAAVRTRIESGVDGEMVGADLEQIGAMVGALQISCCADDRLPLYAELLASLNQAHQICAPMH